MARKVYFVRDGVSFVYKPWWWRAVGTTVSPTVVWVDVPYWEAAKNGMPMKLNPATKEMQSFAPSILWPSRFTQLVSHELKHTKQALRFQIKVLGKVRNFWPAHMVLQNIRHFFKHDNVPEEIEAETTAWER